MRTDAASNFNLGDRVWLVVDDDLDPDYGAVAGNIGIVRRIETDNEGNLLLVEFPGVAPTMGYRRTLHAVYVAPENVDRYETPLQYTPAEACATVRALFDGDIVRSRLLETTLNQLTRGEEGGV